MNLTTLTRDSIEDSLSQQPKQAPYVHFPAELLNGDPRPAAVLLPLLKFDEQWHILFIRRTVVDGDFHSGQVALPGGTRDPDDADNVAAAIRETNEELGIEAKEIQVLGTLNDFITISNYQVTPVIAAVNWPLPLTLAADEVARAFTIPLGWLADEANHEIKHRHLPNGLGSTSVIYFNHYDGEQLWGATARFIFEFLKILGINFSQ
jgi:8-oxo-dGTP pyrophosphatase MutT (NUDIX family)